MTAPKLKDSSSTALLALTVLFFAPGLLILSPDGRIFFFGLAGLVSAVVAVAAPSGKKRAAAVVGLLAAVVMALQTWPDYRARSDTWKRHTSGQPKLQGE